MLGVDPGEPCYLSHGPGEAPGIKSLLALRAFQMLRIDVRSLFWRDAMAAVWAGGV